MNRCLKYFLTITKQAGHTKLSQFSKMNLNLYNNNSANFSWKSKLSSLFGRSDKKQNKEIVDEEEEEINKDNYVTEKDVIGLKKAKKDLTFQENIYLKKSDKADVELTTSQHLAKMLGIKNSRHLGESYNSYSLEEIKQKIKELSDLGFCDEWISRIFSQL